MIRKLKSGGLKSTLLAPAAILALSGLGMLAPQTAEANPAWVFPQNHTDLEWSTIETEHFLVHYPVSKKTAEEGNDHYLTGEWAAHKYARVAEEIWQPMCAEFNYFLKEKINPLVGAAGVSAVPDSARVVQMGIMTRRML